MPKVVVELDVDHFSLGTSGETVASDLFDFLVEELNPSVWRVTGYRFISTTLTDDELDIIRFKGESGKDD